ncbi:hypothetical protein [Asanoa siamensis]|uniref:Outer membrane repeat protein n=1 Tax=Asanoa siamensis TaxID=926357 RepID=A0ABQ4CX24_9ACTN|nr:hypothetical protein [Asanoa siamensis]GIF75831.1 hypothetical protein Asi02nite_53490 [Asanoa siamensis]
MRVRRILAATVAAGSIVVGVPAAASASSYVPCDGRALQAAVVRVNNAGGGTLNLTPRCTYRLRTPASGDNGLAAVTTPIRVNGNRATITRASAANFRFFEIGAAGHLTLKWLTLRNGRTADGGAIFVNGGRLDLVAGTVTGNTATENGGGIYNTGTMAITASSLSDNTAAQGGAVNNQGAEASIDLTTVTRNHVATGVDQGVGGGILNAAPLTLKGVRIAGNTASGQGAVGGGLWNVGDLTMTGGSFVDNVADGAGAGGGGLWNGDSATVTGTRFLFNTASGGQARGGGIFNVAGTVVLNHATVVANQATGAGADGGGIFSETGTVTRTGGTLRGNRPNNCGAPSTVPGCP